MEVSRRLRQIARLLAVVLVLALVGCGDSSDEDQAGPASDGGGQALDVEGAVDAFNGGYPPVVLRDTMNGAGGYAVCGLTGAEDDETAVLLTVVMRDGSWFQATIDPTTGVREEDVSVGVDFDSAAGQTAEEFASTAVGCRLQPTGTISTE